MMCAMSTTDHLTARIDSARAALCDALELDFTAEAVEAWLVELAAAKAELELAG